jgi:hypothetical protein
MSIETQRELGSATRENSMLVRVLAFFGVSILPDDALPIRDESRTARRTRRTVPLWELDEY